MLGRCVARWDTTAAYRTGPRAVGPANFPVVPAPPHTAGVATAWVSDATIAGNTGDATGRSAVTYAV